jgi:hypothetical protein
MSLRSLLRVPTTGEPYSLAAVDPASTPGTDLDKDAAKAELDVLGEELADLQERLWAEGRTAGDAGCWSCCRAWTPAARAAPSSTSSGR